MTNTVEHNDPPPPHYYAPLPVSYLTPQLGMGQSYDNSCDLFLMGCLRERYDLLRSGDLEQQRDVTKELMIDNDPWEGADI